MRKVIRKRNSKPFSYVPRNRTERNVDGGGNGETNLQEFFTVNFIDNLPQIIVGFIAIIVVSIAIYQILKSA